MFVADLESIALVGFDDAQLAEVEAYGSGRQVEAGEMLYRAGDERPSFVVLLEGEAEVVRTHDGGESIVTTRGAGGFLGELNLLTGQRAYLTARMTKAGRVLVVEPDAFRQLMGTKPELSDTVFRAFVARRELLRSGEGADANRSSDRATHPRRQRAVVEGGTTRPLDSGSAYRNGHVVHRNWRQEERRSVEQHFHGFGGHGSRQ